MILIIYKNNLIGNPDSIDVAGERGVSSPFPVF